MSNHGIFNQLVAQTQRLHTINDVLGTIESNTDTLEVNTDGLETILTDGTQVANLTARTSIADAATATHLQCNTSGQLNTQVVNSVNVELHAHTDVADTNTSARLLCDAAGHLQVDMVSGTMSLPTGASTEAKQDSVISTLGDTNNKLDAIRGSNSITDLATKLNGGLPSALDSDKLKVVDAQIADTNSKIDDLRTKADSRNTTLSSIDNKVVLPAALDSGKLKVVDSAVVDVGNKIDAMRASDTLTTVKTALDTLETTLTAIETDQAALEVLHTATNSKIDTIDSVLDSIKVDSGNIKTAVELIDDAIQTDDAAVTLGSQKGIMMMGFAGTQSVNTNDAALLRCGDDGVLDVNVQALPAGGSLESTQLLAEAHLGNIETSVQLLDDVVKTEDAAHGSGDKGIMALAVRQSTQADFGADGDYVPMSINDDGELRVTSSGGMTLTTVDSSLAIGNGATDTSAAVEIKSNGNINILVQSGVLGSSFVLAVEASMDGSTFHTLSSSYLTQQASGNSIQAFIDPSAFRPKFIKLKITNNDVGSQNFDSFVFQ